MERCASIRQQVSNAILSFEQRRRADHLAIEVEEVEEESASPEFEDDDETPAAPPVSSEQKLRKECGFSQSLVDGLKAHRLQITRAYLAGNFEAAFDLALYAVCTDLFRHVGYHNAEDGSADLPAFLTEDEPAITALNGAAAH